MNIKKLNPFEVYRGLPRSVYVLFFATIVNGMGIFVYPFLALFLTQKLNYSVAQAGLFMFIASLAYIPGTFIGGKLTDQVGRRLVLFVSQTIASGMFLVCGFLGTSNLVPFFILLNLFFDGFADPARQAIQTDITTPENRQSSFALTYLGHNLGYSVGPVVAGFLFYRASQWLFFGNALMGFLSVLLNIALIPETKPTKEQLEESLKTDRTDKAVEGTLLMALKERSGLIAFALLISLYGLAYGQTLFSLPLSAVAVFGEERGAGVFGKLMSLNALLVIFLNAPVVSLTRRFRTLANVAFAGLLYTAGFAGFFIARTLPFFYLCTLLWTLGEIVDAVNTWYYIANHTPMSHRGRFGGIFPFITGSGRAIAPYFGGQIIQRFGLGVLWLVTSAITTGGALGIRLLDRGRQGNDGEDNSGA
jgi:MFS family permease